MRYYNSVRAVKQFIADYRWFRQRGYCRRVAWHWAARVIND